MPRTVERNHDGSSGNVIIGFFLFRKGVPTWEELFRQLRQWGRKPKDDD